MWPPWTELGPQTHCCSEIDLSNPQVTSTWVQPMAHPLCLPCPAFSSSGHGWPPFFMKTSMLWACLTWSRLASVYFTAAFPGLLWASPSLETLGVRSQCAGLSLFCLEGNVHGKRVRSLPQPETPSLCYRLSWLCLQQHLLPEVQVHHPGSQDLSGSSGIPS